MRYKGLKPGELAQFAANVRDLLTGTELDAIDPNVRATLVAMIGSLPEVLDSQDGEYLVSKAQTKSFLTGRNSTRDVLESMMESVRGYLSAANAPIEQFDKCAFDPPKKKRSRVVANMPSGLTVTGFSNNVNKGRFVGNNKTGAVTYEIYRREAKDGEWTFRLQVRKQSFTDQVVVPGQAYVYKVRAVAARNTSDFSNECLVFGT